MKVLVPLLLAQACARAEVRETLRFDGEGIAAADVAIARGDLYWTGRPGRGQVVVDVLASATGTNRAAARRHLDALSWSATQDGTTLEIAADSDDRRAAVDVEVRAPPGIDLAIDLARGAVELDGADGRHVVAADEIAVHGTCGEVDLLARRGSLTAELCPPDEGEIALHAVGGGVRLGLPYGTEITLEVLCDPDAAIDVADLGFDALDIGSGYVVGTVGRGGTTVAVLAEGGGFTLYEIPGCCR